MDLCSPKQWPTISGQDLTPSGFPVYGANGRIGFYSTFNHEKPTILVACRGATCGAINVCEPRSYVTGNAMALDDLESSRVELRFMVHALTARGFHDAITGTAQPQITRESLRRVKVSLPPLAEQRRIADVLDKADAIRRKRKEAIALTEDLLRSAFLEMFGDPVTNPKRWPIRSVDELCDSKQYGTAEKANEAGDGIPVLRMNNLTYAGEIDLRDLKWVALPDKERSKLDLRDGDVLFNRVNSHELVGKTAVWHHGDGYTFAGYLIRLRTNQNALGDYVSAAMNMPSVKRVLVNLAKPSINMANISGSDLARLHVPVPPIAAQQKYKQLRRRVYASRDDLSRHSHEAEALFNSLVARAFSGSLEAPR